ncbi:hypothetical protein ZOSMA_76G00090 [Zostera marina]|uniref:FAR1 domain-containing protein n=1 Tax=Zostera marina TaxID=29655 RepID=A0A0K9NNU4_ZOSMR|nr:hypothetical protein ZOSMA_76G00090 [Zostera marina]
MHIADFCPVPSNQTIEIIGSSSTLYIPDVGQLFSTHDETRDAYMGYDGNYGFNVRMVSTKIVDREMIGRRMLCSKQGYAFSAATNDIVNERKHRRIRNSCSGCLAMIYISLDRPSNLWRVVNFIQDHNHPLMTPSKKRYLSVNRVITHLSRALFQSLNTSNISPNDQYCVAVQETGGFDYIQFIPSDLSNMRRDDRRNIIQRDADLLIERFEENQTKSFDFSSRSLGMKMVIYKAISYFFAKLTISKYQYHLLQYMSSM